MAEKYEADRRETAALWYTELQDPHVSPETWEAFLDWEMDPANAAAYREIESTIGIIDRTSFSRSKSVKPGRGRKPVLLALAAAATALIIGTAALTLQVPKAEPASQTYVTAIGEQETVTLEDGSIITLNTNTKLTVGYSNAERLIRLTQGEALFEVAHSDRPFIVEAGGTRTRALGTEFDIHARDDIVSVTLIKGSVRVTERATESRSKRAGSIPEDSLQEGFVLKPGDRLEIASGAEPFLSTINPALVGRWREGLLQFDDTTLAEAVVEMNRYSTVRLRIDDETLAAERISGTFPAGKQQEFAESLRLYLPVEIREQGQEILIVPSAD